MTITSVQVRQYSQADEEQFLQARELLKNESGMDFYTQEGTNHNTNLIGEFFQKNRNTPVTVQTVFAVVEQRKNEFTWLSREQIEYSKVAAEDVGRATAVENWLARQGQPGNLVNTGDKFFHNATELLLELRGHEITPMTIQAAIGRIGAPSGRFDTRHRRPLHFVPLQRRVDPRQHPVDDNHKPGQFITDANKSPLDYLRDSRAKEEAAQPVSEKQLSKEEATWRQMGEELLKYGTHSKQQELRTLWSKCKADGMSYRQMFDIVKKLVNQFERSKQLSIRSF